MQKVGSTSSYKQLVTQSSNTASKAEALETRVNTNEGSISTLQDEIKLKVTESGVLETLRDHNYTSRNMLKDSNAPTLTKVYAPKNRYFSSNTVTSVVPTMATFTDCPCGATYGFTAVSDGSNSSNRGLCFYTDAKEPVLDLNLKYTVSCWVRVREGSAATVRLNYGTTSYTGKTFTLVGSENRSWTRISWTFKPSSTYCTANGDQYYSRIYFLLFATNAATVDFCGFQLEQGEVATDWTPNVGEYTHLLSSRIADAEVKIEPAAITSTVMSQTQTALEGKNLSSFLSTVTSDVSSAASAASNAASTANTALSTANNITVGARNLLLATGTSKTATIASSADNAYTGYYYTSNYGTTLMKDKTSDVYTISFDWELTGGTSTTTIYAQLNGVAVVSADGGKIEPVIGTATSGHYEVRFKQTTAQINYTSSTRMRFRIRNSAAGAVLTVKNVKLEKGNKATSWTAAPEDLEGEVSTISGNVSSLTTRMSTAEQKITPEQITSTVLDTVTTELKDETGTSTTLAKKLSAIEQTASSINLSVENAKQRLDSLNTSSRNLFKNTLNAVADPAASRPMIIGQTQNTTMRAGTYAAATHGIRDTVGSATFPYIRFGNSSYASCTMNGLTAGKTYTMSFDYTAKLYSGVTSATAYYLRVYLLGDKDGGTSFANLAYSDLGQSAVWGSQGQALGSTQSSSIHFTFTVPTTTTRCYLIIRPNQATDSYFKSGDFIEVRNLMLVEGSIPSSWAPAAEDLTSYSDSSTASLKLYVDGDTYKSGIRMSADEITWTADNSSMDSKGHLTASSATFTNAEIDCRNASSGFGLSIGPYGDLAIGSPKPSNMSSFNNNCAFQVNNQGDVKLDELKFYKNGTQYGGINIGVNADSTNGIRYMSPDGNMKMMIRNDGTKFWTGVNIATSCTVGGALTVSGSKNRRVETADFGDVLLSAYETPTPMFGDVGEGVIGADGLCYIDIDPVFSQCINTNSYQVFLQAYGRGELWVSLRTPSYFIVEGTAGLAFGWEVKGKQADLDQRRFHLASLEDGEITSSESGEDNKV